MVYRLIAKRRRRLGKTIRKAMNTTRNIGTMAKVAHDVYKLKKIVNSETKYVDSAGSAAFSATGTLVAPTYPASGTGENNRTGSSIKVKAFNLRLFAQCESSIVTLNRINSVRVIVFTDHEPSVAPVVSDILDNTSVYSPHNFDSMKSGRFNIMMDKVYTLDANNTTLNLNKWFSINHHAQFNTNTTALLKNRIYWIILSDYAPLIADARYDYQTRLEYYDN